MTNKTTSVLLAGAAVGGLLATAAPAAAETSLTIVSWGGAYTESQVRAYH